MKLIRKNKLSNVDGCSLSNCANRSVVQLYDVLQLQRVSTNLQICHVLPNILNIHLVIHLYNKTYHVTTRRRNCLIYGTAFIKKTRQKDVNIALTNFM